MVQNSVRTLTGSWVRAKPGSGKSSFSSFQGGLKNAILFSAFRRNKPGTAKVGAISKAQKARSFKIVNGGPFGLCETPVGCKI